MIDPLRPGAASLVIYADGSVNVGQRRRVAERPEHDSPGPRRPAEPRAARRRRPAHPPAGSADWQAWGSTCGASSCAASVPGIEHQWRSALGVTAESALVYVQGPALDLLQLAVLLTRAGVIRGMELDINPD